MDRVNEILGLYKYPLLLGLVGFVLIFSGSFSSLFKPQTAVSTLPEESIVKETGSFVTVDIGGAVLRPGVYDLPKESRVDDLIKEAGGFVEEVNNEFVSKHLNLSQKISDSQKLYIPFQGESFSSSAVAGISTTTTGLQAKVNVNTGSQSDLEVLPGVGPSTASKIIAGRPYENVQDLLAKKVVGKATFEKVKNLVEL